MKKILKEKVGDILIKLSRLKKIKKSNYKILGKFPIIDQGTNFIAGFTDDEQGLNTNLPITLFGDHTRIMRFIKKPFVAGADGTHCLIPNKGYDRRYFFYTLKNLKLKNYGYERHFKYLKEEFIPKHKFKNQQKIAIILSNYDDLIENNIKRIELLEKTAKLIYEEWFVKFKFPGYKDVNMSDSKLGKMPKGWKVINLEELFKIKTGKTDAKDAVENGKYPLYDRSKIIKKSNKFLFKSKAIIIPGEGKEFNPRYYEGKFDLHQRAYAIMPKIDRKIMYFFIWIDKHKDYFGRVATGATVKSLRMNNFEKFPTMLPSEDILIKFEELVVSIFSSISNLEQKNKNLQQTRDLLLPKLINGIVDVSNLEIVVPEVEA